MDMYTFVTSGAIVVAAVIVVSLYGSMLILGDKQRAYRKRQTKKISKAG